MLDTVIVPVPVFLTVKTCAELDEPRFTLPKVASATMFIAGARATPVPDVTAVLVVVGPFHVTPTFVVAKRAPDAVGLKITLKDALPPALMVNGTDGALII